MTRIVVSVPFLRSLTPIGGQGPETAGEIVRAAKRSEDIQAIFAKSRMPSRLRGHDSGHDWEPRANRLATSTRGASYQLKSLIEQIERLEGVDARVDRAADTLHPTLFKLMSGSNGLAYWLRTKVATQDPAWQATWWAGLSESEGNSFVGIAPEVVGNLPGLPGRVRDLANRSRLPEEFARWNQHRNWYQANSSGFNPFENRGEVELAEERLASISAILNFLETDLTNPTDNPNDRYLLGYAVPLGGRTEAIIANGDIDQAAHVAVLTPGTTSTVTGMGGGLAELDQLRDDAAELLPSQSVEEVATVLWLGYQAPEWNHTVATTDSAQHGGAELQKFLGGINAQRPDVNLTAIGHSYGCTTTGYALQGKDVGVDNAVFAGSPGTGTSDAHDLHVPPGRAFVLENAQDPVADLGTFGKDPNQLNGTVNLSTSETAQYRESAGHSDYFALYDDDPTTGEVDRRSTSQANTAAVIAGQYDALWHGKEQGFGDLVRQGTAVTPLQPVIETKSMAEHHVFGP